MNDRAQELRISAVATDSDEAQEVARALAAHVTAFGPRSEAPLSLVARDSGGRLVGGLNATSHWRWLYIRHFWIAPERRRTGLGAKLLTAAEAEARARGCIGLYLDTFDARAERFYGRCGFERFGTLEDFPPGHSRRFLRKAL